MVRWRFTVDGTEEAARYVREVGGRMSGAESLQPVMSILAEDWSSSMQERIRRGELDLPPQHPVTKAIRRYYGHDGSPRLVRGGDLLLSIGPLLVEDRAFEVGTTYPYADELQYGGETTDPHGRTVPLPAHPFIVIDDQMVDDAVQMLADYVMEGPTGA